MYVQNQVKCMLSQKEQTFRTLRNELQSFIKTSTKAYGRPNIKYNQWPKSFFNVFEVYRMQNIPQQLQYLILVWEMENEVKFVDALQMLLCSTNFENYMYHNLRFLIRGRQHTLLKLAMCSNSSNKLVCLKGKHGCGHCETSEQKRSMQNKKTRRQPPFVARSFHNGKCISKLGNPICG
jgi:hypothetical protein